MEGERRLVGVVRPPAAGPRLGPEPAHRRPRPAPRGPSRHPLFDIAHHVVDAKWRYTGEVLAAGRALPQTLELRLRDLLVGVAQLRRVERLPQLVAVAELALDRP